MYLGYVKVVESGFPENGHDSSVISCTLDCDGTSKIYYVYFDTEFTLDVNRRYSMRLFKNYSESDFADMQHYVIPNQEQMAMVSNGVTFSFENNWIHNHIECHPAAEILFYLKDSK